jgi:hypothetical protein
MVILESEWEHVRKVTLLKQCYVWTNPSKFIFKKIDIKTLKKQTLKSQVNTSYPPPT